MFSILNVNVADSSNVFGALTRYFALPIFIDALFVSYLSAVALDSTATRVSTGSEFASTVNFCAVIKELPLPSSTQTYKLPCFDGLTVRTRVVVPPFAGTAKYKVIEASSGFVSVLDIYTFALLRYSSTPLFVTFRVRSLFIPL